MPHGSVSTWFAPLSRVHEVPRPGKQEIADSSPEADGQEQPAIVSHGDQHEKVSDADLDHVQD